MERISWSQVRSRFEPELSLELRLCLELLWVMPPPEAGVPLTLLPSNVLVGTDGTVLLGPTSPEDFVKQTRYVAPELSTTGGALASAIYAVGAMLYEAVSGLRFESSEAVGREVRSRRARAVAMGTEYDAVEIELLELALKATQPARHPRWATPESFSRELGHVAGDRTATREQLAEFIAELTREHPVSGSAPPAGETPKPLSFRQPTATSYSDNTPRIEVLASPKRRFPAVEITGPLRPSDDRGVDPTRADSAAPSTPGHQIRTLRGFSLDLTGYPGEPATEAERGAPDSARAGVSGGELAAGRMPKEGAPPSLAKPDTRPAFRAQDLATESLLHDTTDLDPRPSPRPHQVCGCCHHRGRRRSTRIHGGARLTDFRDAAPLRSPIDQSCSGRIGREGAACAGTR